MTVTTTNTDHLPPLRDGLKPGPEPNVRLLKAPWTSDPLFWSALALLLGFGYAAVSGSIRTATTPSGVSWMWWTEILTIAVTTSVFVTLILLIPAWIRRAMWKSRRSRALKVGPLTRQPGWYPDPSDTSRFRLWAGREWSHAVAPVPASDPGWLGVVLMTIALTLPICVFTAWGLLATMEGVTRSLNPAELLHGPRKEAARQAVEYSFLNLRVSTKAFDSSPIDQDDIRGSLLSMKSKLPTVKSDFEYFQAVLSGITSDQELNPDGLSLREWRGLEADMATWIALQEDVFSALEPCFAEVDDLEFLRCSEATYRVFSDPLQESSLQVDRSLESVLESMSREGVR